MNDLNSVYLVGRLTADPVQKIVNKASTWTFTLANNEYRYDEQKKEYVSSTAFFKVALSGRENEKVALRLKKGIRVGVNGRLVQKDKTFSISSLTIQVLDPVFNKEAV